ncbi:Origin recognition complex subunit 2 [Nakaseomyces glabratus]|nr:Origin recognition complex subunit 2 [Nakaseomyces glabratus]KAH7592408.1 Origin recognition complex subunit 2 [Nakaseomyces glabratus]KAJ9568893.1 Origin recognition complex subunit 2 [Nakaseomyces glabratus]KTB12691.1 Origin recognition complex subunit 2 [Nakaseomyces glabratus]KTB21086.1 Origin recognition complex subunit 2 [Nakaseomyces glabratus]
MSPPETPKKESLKENEDLAIKENGTSPREIGDKIKVESAGEYETPELTSDEENLVQLQTPRKRRKVNLSKEHDFTSPLKKVIMNNLNEYKKSDMADKLKLSRDFVNTQVPRPADVEKLKANRAVTSFTDTFEGYFEQKRSVRGVKVSKNSITMAPHVTREEFGLISNIFHRNLHKNLRDHLYIIQKKLYPQYWFEVIQGFSLLFYGIGSKKVFLEDFVFKYLSPKLALSQAIEVPTYNGKKSKFEGIPVVVVNGYNPTCNYRDVFKDILSLLTPAELTQSESKFWGNHVIMNIQKLIDYYKDKPLDIKLIVAIHNIDGPNIRRGDSPTILSFLSLIRQVAIVASADHIYAPFLWDNLRAQNYNFVFHDVTNYAPYEAESSFQDVMRLGKSENSTGAEGAKYVLQSLTLNSKKMYKLLIETQLQHMEKVGTTKSTGKVAASKRGTMSMGVEFKQLVHLCAADFIASNEMALRSMLTEFIEHKMASVSKNTVGTEFVWVPYTYAEMKRLQEILYEE